MLGQTITYMEIDGQPINMDEDGDDTLNHLWCDCMGETVALCGSDLSYAIDQPFYEDYTDACVVCLDLDKTHDDICTKEKN